MQSLADQIGVVAPGDDPLAALDVIGQRCRELSAKCHHKPTSATDPMTVPQQLGAAVEATKSRDDDDASHVVQVNEALNFPLSMVDLYESLISGENTKLFALLGKIIENPQN